MALPEEQLQDLLERTKARERRARRRAILYSLVPILLAAVLIWFTARQVEQARAKLEPLQAQLAQTERELNRTQQALADTSASLERSRRDLESVNLQLERAQGLLKRSREELQTTLKKLSDASREAARLKEEAEKHRKQAAELQDRVRELGAQMEALNDGLDTIRREMGRQQILAMHFSKFLFRGDEQAIAKHLAANYPSRQKLFADILEAQGRGVRWDSQGFSPAGFDSPGFAAFLLEKNRLISVPAAQAHRRLRQLLPRREKPQVGDLVFYGSNDALFYFLDEKNTPFVIGMTHLGILALRPEFDRIDGYGAVPYQK